MTLQELCAKYGVAESSVLNTFPRTQKSILKKYGVKIVKQGRGASTIYLEEYEDDQRALTMFDESKENIVLSEETVGLMNWDFLVFLAIVVTPMFVFRGSYEDFLKYVQLNTSETNIELLKDALLCLKERDLISYNIDKTNGSYFVAALYRKVEEDMQIGIGMVRTCKQLADKHNKRSWIPLLKTWLSINVLAEHQPYTIGEIEAMTGLSAYQIRQSTEILKEANIFKTSRAYAGVIKCLGMNVDLNREEFYTI